MRTTSSCLHMNKEETMFESFGEVQLYVKTGCIFSQGYSLYFFLNFAQLWWFGVLGFGVGVFY